MGRRKSLNEDERGQAKAYKSTGMSTAEIARRLSRSRSAIANYLSAPENYGTSARSGRPKALTKRSENCLFRMASNESLSSKQLKDRLELRVSARTVRHYLYNCPFLKYEKMNAKPPLTAEHKSARLQYARSHHFWNLEWNNVIFSDEKKFNLDGPDGLCHYWHDLRKEKRYFSKRVQGGGSVMVWAAFSRTWKRDIVFISTRMNASTYSQLLSHHLLPHIRSGESNLEIFQQDNAPCHRAQSTMRWLSEQGVAVMEWPSRSPDLNPIENLWGILVRSVYAGGKQFSTVAALREAIRAAWADISFETLGKLTNSMKNRMFELIAKQGGGINYWIKLFYGGVVNFLPACRLAKSHLLIKYLRCSNDILHFYVYQIFN